MLRRLITSVGPRPVAGITKTPVVVAMPPPSRNRTYYHAYRQAEQKAHYKGSFAKVTRWPGKRISRWSGDICTAVAKNKFFRAVWISKPKSIRCPGTMIYVRRSRSILVDADEYRAMLPHPLASVEVV